MRCLNNKIGIIFDENHLKTYNLGGIELIRASSWVHREDDGETGTKKETNVNHLETNPQIGVVGMESEDSDYKLGDKLFLNYLAYETGEEKIVIDGEDCYPVDLEFVMFKIQDGEYILPEGKYIAEEIIDEAPKTASGIYITSQENEPSKLKVKVTHVASDLSNFKIGEEIVTIDEFNYPFKIDDKKYFYISEEEIIGVLK